MHPIDVVETDWRSFDGRTALFIASDQGFIDSMQLLLDCGADPNITDVMDNAPILAGM